MCFLKEIIKVKYQILKTNTWSDANIRANPITSSNVNQESHYTVALNLKALKMYAKFCVSLYDFLRKGYLKNHDPKLRI